MPYCEICEVFVKILKNHYKSRYHISKIEKRGVKRKRNEDIEDLFDIIFFCFGIVLFIHML